MKLLFACLPIWLLACVALAVNSLEQEFLCPICGTHWEQRIETSGRSRGLRLDLRQLGDVVDPPTLPQCPKCRFPLFSDRLLEQARDPAKANAFKRLRTFVLGADFQMLTAKNPPYFALALVQGMNTRNPTPHRYLALSYLRASWQVEDREAVCRRLLEKAREHYAAALDEISAEDPRRADLALLCGEIERRLGKWDDAERRFRELESSDFLKGTPRAAIPELQRKLIARHDSAPHTLEDAVAAVAAVDRPVPAREIRFENPGQISMAANRWEDRLVMRPEAPPFPAPVPDLPAVLFELPEPVLQLPSGPAERPEAGLMLGLPPTGAQTRMPDFAPEQKEGAVMKAGLPSAAPAHVPPVKVEPPPRDKPADAAKLNSPPKEPVLPPIAEGPKPLAADDAPVKAPPPPGQPDSNFSDSPD